MTNRESPQYCACDTKNLYSLCCGKYISREQIPDTAVALMRSRYTAYTLLDIDYIQATMQGIAAQGFNAHDALAWAQSIKWKRLKVLAHYPHETDENRYYVQFLAYYIIKGVPQKFTEVSEFQKINGRWYYIDGKIE